MWCIFRLRLAIHEVHHEFSLVLDMKGRAYKFITDPDIIALFSIVEMFALTIELCTK